MQLLFITRLPMFLAWASRRAGCFSLPVEASELPSKWSFTDAPRFRSSIDLVAQKFSPGSLNNLPAFARLLRNSLVVLLAAMLFALSVGITHAQSNWDQLYQKLPDGNRRILRSLEEESGLSIDWDKPKSRDTSKTIASLLSSSDKKAWELLNDSFVYDSNTTETVDEWRDYWRLVDGVPTTTPVYTAKGLRLLRIPPASVPSEKFPLEHKGILPGDVLLFNGEFGPVLAIYWGDRSFPKRKMEVSFMYYSNLTVKKKKLIDKNEFIFGGGTSYNSYPPRITPDLYSRLFQDKDEKRLTPNDKIFRAANGYLSTSELSKRLWLYGDYYLPEDSWEKQAPKLAVFRRKSGGNCSGEIDIAALKKIFPNASKSALEETRVAFNESYAAFGINTCDRRAHFFAQVLAEVGEGMTVKQPESLNYMVEALIETFGYFKSHKAEAKKYGRIEQKDAKGRTVVKQKADQVAIANRAYANRLGNGDIESGDGYRWRGRGFIQITGKDTYNDVQKVINEKLPKAGVDVLKGNSEDVQTIRGGLISAMAYWSYRDLNRVADSGKVVVKKGGKNVTYTGVDAVTAIVNLNTSTYDERRANFEKTSKVFR